MLSQPANACVDWAAGIGLARTVVDDAPRVVLRGAGSSLAHVATVGGQTFEDVTDLLEAADGDHGAIQAGDQVDAPNEALLAPVGRSRKIVCVGLNYGAHAVEALRNATAYPALFPKWQTCLAAPYEDIHLPRESVQVDFESELVVVIGRVGRRIPEDRAEDFIFGYTAANDGSVRDFQRHTGQVLPGKVWDGLTPLGPIVVPAANLGGARPNLLVQGILDGEVLQEDRTMNMVFGPPELVSYVSTMMTLEPGDLILTGTPAGVGFVRSPPVFLGPGSEFEVRIEGIGSLRNRYVEEPT